MLNLNCAGNSATHKFTEAMGEKPCRLSFSVAVKTGKDSTAWVSCSMYGSRAEKLWPFFRDAKSIKVAVSGRPWVSAKDDKGYLNLSVDTLTFMGSKEDNPAPTQMSADKPPF
jgi:hypothetical protein